MMKSEFIERTGFEPTQEEYSVIEQEYMGTDIDKDKFCRDWKRNGGIQRLSRQRVARIEELERSLELSEARAEKNFQLMNKAVKELNGVIESKSNQITLITERATRLDEELTELKQALAVIKKYI